MNLLPYEYIELNSDLTSSEVVSRISEILEYKNDLGLSNRRNSTKTYEGLITEDGFKVRRILKFGYNSFIPIAHGKILTNGNKTTIQIKLKLNKIVFYMLIGFTLFSSFRLYLEPIDLNSIFRFLIPYLFATIFFNYEAGIIKKDLIKTILEK